MNERSAIEILAEGQFPTAYQIFIKQLREFPDDAECQAGFYFSGWWNNRTEILQQKEPGRALAIYLAEQWQASLAIAEAKKLEHTQAFQTICIFILRQVAKNFFFGYHSERKSTNTHAPLILKISQELLKFNFPQESYQLLTLIQKGGFDKSTKTQIKFLIAESLCCQDGNSEQEQGLNQLRDLLISRPTDYQPNWICSPNLKQIQKKMVEESDWPWIATYFHFMAQEKQMLRPLTARQSSYLAQEVDRLLESIPNIAEKFRDKTIAVLCFYTLTLIYELKKYQTSAKMELEKYCKIFDETAPAKFREMLQKI